MNQFNLDDYVKLQDAVDPHDNRIFQIKAVPGGRRVNYEAHPINGGNAVKGKHYCFAPASDAEVAAAKAQAAEGKALPRVVLGTIVRVPSINPAKLFVAIASRGVKANITELGGGMNNSYHSGVPLADMTVIDASRLSLD